MQEQDKEKIAKHIAEAFQKQLGVTIKSEKILEYINNLKKLGVTNAYTNVFEIDGKEYLIRINGKLWSPYERKTEAFALDVLKKNGIETNVLFNGDDFQICKAPENEKSLKTHLSKNNETDIKNALKLIAKKIVQYQKLTAPNIEYPISKMLNDAIELLDRNFKENQVLLATLKGFSELCKKIIVFGERANLLFCHNDLFAKSVFIDLTSSKVTIVDWEYAAKAYWPNDLAMLGRFLTLEQLDYLADEYYQATGFGNKMPDLQKDFLKFNRFVLKFLYEIVWADTEKPEFAKTVTEMQAEADLLSKKLDENLQQSLTSNLPFSQNIEKKDDLKQEEKKSSEYNLSYTASQSLMPQPKRQKLMAQESIESLFEKAILLPDLNKNLVSIIFDDSETAKQLVEKLQQQRIGNPNMKNEESLNIEMSNKPGDKTYIVNLSKSNYNKIMGSEEAFNKLESQQSDNNIKDSKREDTSFNK